MCLYNRCLIFFIEEISIIETRFYNLEPIGLGTEFSESLSSYLVRLAEAHSLTVGDLVNKEIALVLNKAYLLKSANDGGSRFFDASYELNGLGHLASDWARTLGNLTGRTELENLTLFRFNEWLPERGVLRKSLAWCPVCLEEWKMSQRQIYEPLLWNLQSITHCISHKIKLQTECPNCRRKIQILSRKRRIGYCPNCCAWLGCLGTVAGNVKELNWQLFAIKNLGELLLTKPQKVKEFASRNIYLTIQAMINNIGSRSAFSRKTGFPKTTVRSWYDGIHRPSLEALLKICYFSDLHLTDLLSGKYNEFKIRPDLSNKQKSHIKISRREFKKEDVEKILLAFLSEQTSVSMNKVARRLDCDKRILYRHFPKLCRAISQKYLNYIRECRDQRINEACTRVKEATIQLYNRGVYPSRRRVEGFLQIEILREKSLQGAWHDTLISLGLSVRKSK